MGSLKINNPTCSIKKVSSTQKGNSKRFVSKREQKMKNYATQ